ncbi:hypothetical protein ACFQ9Z_15470 [Streptomyces sp. NPDC056580]|uniref:hypothetical protein n=1 Tax=Streptomyces sp. NPDC056580 TaxID=3345872 RepID=UPI003680B76F
MPSSGARRRTKASGPAGESPPAFELSLPEYQAVLRVIEHARACLVLRSGSDAATIHNASGAELASLLHQRASAASARGVCEVPMLAGEIRHLEAAVLNLESYGGHETVLCDGYALLERCEALAAVLSRRST